MEAPAPRPEPHVTLSFANVPFAVRRRVLDTVRALLLNSAGEPQAPEAEKRPRHEVTLFADGSVLDRTPGSAALHEVPLYYVQPPPPPPRADDPLGLASAPGCYNCGESGHRLPECRAPRDEERIAAARPARRERYFAGSEKAARHAHLRPGQLSAELRAALGLAPGQLPEWVLRWQVHGPPPYARKAAQEAAEVARRREAARAAGDGRRVDEQGDVRMDSDEEAGAAADGRKRARTEKVEAETEAAGAGAEASRWAELQRILRAERQQQRGTPQTTPTKS